MFKIPFPSEAKDKGIGCKTMVGWTRVIAGAKREAIERNKTGAHEVSTRGARKVVEKGEEQRIVGRGTGRDKLV